MQPFTYYIKQFGKLKRAVVRGEGAPHKPVLLLAVLHRFDALYHGIRFAFTKSIIERN